MTVHRVLIVDDSRLMRQVLSDLINAQDDFTVASTASDGEEAVRLALELAPDMITMDLEMPRMNGLDALQRIMAVRPVPVIMLSAVTDNGARDTIRALQFGAFDFVRKPDRSVNLDIEEFSRYLLEKLRVASESLKAGTLRMLPAVEEMSDSRQDRKKHGADPPSNGEAVAAAEAVEAVPPSPAGRSVTMNPLTVQDPRVHSRTDVPRPSGAAANRPASGGKKLPASGSDRTAESGTPAARPKPASGANPAKIRQPGMSFPRSPVRDKASPKEDSPAAAPKTRSAEPAGKIRGQTSFRQLIAVGTSTGGPRALHELLTSLPADLEAPVLVVQHMPPKFTHSLAQRLNAFCKIRVQEAEHGTIVETGTAYIAPGGKQMTLERDSTGVYRIRLSEDGPRSGHMPSVDVLFESLVGIRELARHIVLMTGMGSDGALGMKALMNDGCEIRIAESAETCVVYGMPRSAVEMGAASHVLPLQQIAPFLLREVRARSRTHNP